MTTVELLKPLSDGLARSHPGFSNSDLERAFNAADKAHSGQLRKSGEPYITHPVGSSDPYRTWHGFTYCDGRSFA